MDLPDAHINLWDFLNHKSVTPDQIDSLSLNDLDESNTHSRSNQSNEPIFKVDIVSIGGKKFVKINYSHINCPRSLKIAHQARGIILSFDKNDGYSVVCYPFDRFFNWSEEYSTPIDWESVQILEKIDGSLLMAWWCDSISKWVFSTRNKIIPVQPFKSLIPKILRENKISLKKFQKDHTYCFEVYTKSTQVKLSYETDRFVHIATRSLSTLQEIDFVIDSRISKPKKFIFESYKEVCGDNTPNIEGYVLVDKNFHRQKVKTKRYQALIADRFLTFSRLYQTNGNIESLTKLLLLYIKGEISNSLYDDPSLLKLHNGIKNIYENWKEYCVEKFDSALSDPCGKVSALRNKTFPAYLKRYLDSTPQLTDSLLMKLLEQEKGLLFTVVQQFTPSDLFQSLNTHPKSKKSKKFKT